MEAEGNRDPFRSFITDTGGGGGIKEGKPDYTIFCAKYSLDELKLSIARALTVLLLPAVRANIDPIEPGFLVRQQRVIMLLVGKSSCTTLAGVGA